MLVTHILKRVILKALSLFDLTIIRINKSRNKLPSKDQESIFLNGVNKETARRIFQFDKYNETRNLRGAIVEAGVGSGDGILFLLKLQNESFDQRILWAFDSFAGFPEGHQFDSEEFRKHGKPSYKDFTLSNVKKSLISKGVSDSELARVRFIEGFIPDSFMHFHNDEVALLNCDLDLYEPTKQTLVFFWPRMLKGGVVMLDEYDLGSDLVKWPGAKKAIDEFCVEHNIHIKRGFGNRAFLKK